ncbi:MAG: hypothetical protein P8174_12145 [Gemmatimonadota bacterium]
MPGGAEVSLPGEDNDPGAGPPEVAETAPHAPNACAGTRALVAAADPTIFIHSRRLSRGVAGD